MRILTTMLMAMLFAMPAIAQQSLRGTVKDASDHSVLPGANVVIEGTFQGTHTSSDGSFNLNGLSREQITLKISFLGFQTQTLEVDLSRVQQLEILLERSSFLSQEVVVNATRADNRTPSTRTDVNREEIQSSNLGQDLPYLLTQTPNLITSSDAGAGIGYTWMNIRGSDNSRINVTINGIPVNDSESHGVWWVNMPDLATSTENIQIQRGVGTSTQGAASFGATISIQTLQLQEESYAEVFSSAGSFNTLRNSVSFGTGLLGKGWVIDGRLSKINSDGYVDRSTSDLKSFYLSGGYYGNRTALRAIVFSGKESTYQAWYGVPGHLLETNRTYNPAGAFTDSDGNLQFYDNETDNYQQDHYQLHLTHQLDPSWVANASLHYTYGRGYYEQYRQNQRFRNYGLPNVTIDETVFDRTDLIRQRWLDNHFYGLTYSVNYNSFGRLQGVLGGGFNRYDGDHFGEVVWARLAKDFDKGYRYYDNEASKTDFNTFLKLNYELFDGFYVFGDLQYREIVYDFEGRGMVNEEIIPLDQRAVFNFWNPKTGFLYDITPAHNMYVFFGISNREPVRRDFTESSPESRPRHETMRNLELGYKFNTSQFFAAVNYYLMDYKDQLVLTGEINDVGGFTRTNIEDSYRMGVEMEAAYRFSRLLEMSGNLSLSRNKIPEFTEYSDVYDENWNWTGVHVATYEDTDIAFSPSVVGSVMLKTSPVKNGAVALTGKYVSEQYIDNTMNKDRMLDAYFVNDLRFSYTFNNSFFREIEFSFAIHNLFDVDYITNAWIYKGILGESELMALDDGYFPQAGRHFLAGLRLRI
ncbi:MAG: TonB-dependent receptor [Bacteroidetes bacterium]|nr:MAG: TonB-dependent receptor [Bacteroidota bacterium]